MISRLGKKLSVRASSTRAAPQAAASTANTTSQAWGLWSVTPAFGRLMQDGLHRSKARLGYTATQNREQQKAKPENKITTKPLGKGSPVFHWGSLPLAKTHSGFHKLCVNPIPSITYLYITELGPWEAHDRNLLIK